jgi:hypothetical protein
MSFGEMLTCVRENIPAIAVVFNNGQWGAEKKNQIDVYADRFIGTELQNPSFAGIAAAMGAEGHQGRPARHDRRCAPHGRRLGQADRDRADGDAGTRRPFPPRRAEEAGSAPRHISGAVGFIAI